MKQGNNPDAGEEAVHDNQSVDSKLIPDVSQGTCMMNSSKLLPGIVVNV